MRNPEFRPLQEKTILGVLYHIRADIVREGKEGLEHVDALLVARGVDPEAQAIPGSRPRRFKRGHLTRAIQRALRDGPGTWRQIAARISNDPEIAHSVRDTLYRLRRRGLVVVVSPQRGQIRQVWGLA